MNFKEWLSDNGVVEHKAYNTTYENLENVIGKQYWICDYRLNSNKDNKPIRNVLPKLVKVFGNDVLPKNKNVYYSPIHFREVKGDKILSTIIAPFDNTGYRSYSGVSVNIFNSEKECREYFEMQCDEAVLEYKNVIERLNDRIVEIGILKNNSRYEEMLNKLADN